MGAVIRLPLASVPMITRLDFHHWSWKADLIMSEYIVFKPGLGQRLMGPRTLSSGATSCWPSGLSDNSFMPSFGKMRPSADISVGLLGGPTAWDAAEELGMLILTADRLPRESAAAALALTSREPNGLTPLKSFWARPSQKLRKLNTALMLLGVLRPV